MKKITILLALLLVAVSQGAYAQRTITGKAINGEDEFPMPGVSVVVKGTTIGMVTDKDGNFALKVPNDATIVVSFTGFKTVQIPLASYSYTQFNITLYPDVIALGNVVVTALRNNQREKVITAMGIERDQKTLTTAISQISGDELRRTGNTDIGKALYGKVPNLTIRTEPGAGGGTSIMLRGAGSFEPLNNLPLFVIDGVPLPKTLEQDLSWINIEDVESVTVLRSANAAILYGSQGAAGAIVITLKKR